MTLEKLIKIMRIIIIIGLVIIVLESLLFEYGHCDVCNLKIKDKTYSSLEFMQLYSNKCFEYKLNEPMNNLNLVP